jgi:alkyl sulfatase BDS1-like metallo-beta-lactamase superfamily hydrolase
MAEIELPKHLETGEGYGLTRWNVRAIWEGYAGWFHARSTTELYSTPSSAVHEDLVRLAGGADRIAEAAEQRLANGEAVEAIHLCEVALTASVDHERTLTTYLAAHEHLLESQAHNNFWLTRWIEREIVRARSALEKIP